MFRRGKRESKVNLEGAHAQTQTHLSHCKGAVVVHHLTLNHWPVVAGPPMSPLYQAPHKHIHTQTNTHIYAYTHTHTPTHRQGSTHAHAHIQIHTCEHKYIQAHTHITHTCMHTRLHTCISKLMKNPRTWIQNFVFNILDWFCSSLKAIQHYG